MSDQLFARGRRIGEHLRQDVRYSIRTLRRSPGFAAIAVLSLAFGIGANAAMFSVVNSVVLRPLPFAHPERLVRIEGSSALMPRGDAVMGLGMMRAQSTSFDAMAACEVTARYLRDASGAERVLAVRAELPFFSVLGVRALFGRTFADGDPPTVAVVSESFWRRRLGGARSALGTSINFDGEPFTVIGVMPDSFQFPYRAASLLSGRSGEARTEVWLPVATRPQGRSSNVTARLKPGVSIGAAERELQAIAKRLDAERPAVQRGRGVYLVPLADAVVPLSVRRPLMLLFGAVAIVLALACANVTNLSLVRMTIRSRELAVRAAVGASPWRLVAQRLTESMLLSVAGGLTGFALAWWGTNQLMSMVNTYLPRAAEVGVDWAVFLFLLAVCTLAALAFGLAPAIFAMRADPHAALQEAGGHNTMARQTRRLRDGLVVAEVALAFLLALGATMLIRELLRLRQVDVGMVTRDVVTVHLGHRMTPQSDVTRYYEIAERVSRLPGVRAAGFTQMLPLQNWGWFSNSSDFFIRGRPSHVAGLPIELRFVTPGYFEALGMRVRGRGFTAADDRDHTRVIVINETLARAYFPNSDPIGVEMNRGTIVGVAADVRQVNLDRPALPEIYYAAAQNWSQVSELGMTLVVSAPSRPAGLAASIRAIVQDVDPNQAIFGIKWMDTIVEDSLFEFTLYLRLMAGFALLALLLAASGTYGVITYVATSRMREFAIRVALGADKARVARLLVARALGLAAIGLGCGLVASLAATPLLRNLPVTVRPPSIGTVAPLVVLIAIVAGAACLVPAVRAGRVDAMSVLREE